MTKFSRELKNFGALATSALLFAGCQGDRLSTGALSSLGNGNSSASVPAAPSSPTTPVSTPNPIANPTPVATVTPGPTLVPTPKPSPTSTPVSSPTPNYLGCYSDSSVTRALPNELATSGATIESCIALAQAQNLPYAGLQYGGQCFAGNSLSYALSAASNCNMPCTANTNETCGGSWFNSIYGTGVGTPQPPVTTPPPTPAPTPVPTPVIVTGPTPPPQASGYNLVLNSDFTKMTSLNLGGPGATWWNNFNDPGPTYQIGLSGGLLNLNWSNTQGNVWTSITTAGPGDGTNMTAWQHFYVEVKMAWDVTTGSWPTLWMLPPQLNAKTVNSSTPGGEFGEIDIFESQGTDGLFFGSLHDWTNINSRTHDNSKNTPINADMTQPHTYGLLWTPGQMTWYFDNQALFSLPSYPIMEQQVYYLLLTNGEGTNWSYGQGASSVPSMWMHVYWAHIFSPP